MFSNDELAEGVVGADFRAISRLITLCENRVPRGIEVLNSLPIPSHKTQVVGVTGSPGVGKSSLVDRLVAALAEAKKKVAVVAIDPSSPFSGGAVLGDRIRMGNALAHSEVFVRSMATRGSLGGISRGTHDALRILEAAAFDYVIVETVGVGQAEIDIVRSADTCVVVLVPGMGDSVQALKAGVMEIADLFVINKSDLPGADILHKDLKVLLGLVTPEEGSWKPGIVRTVATEAEGTEEVLVKLGDHFEWLTSSPFAEPRRIELAQQRILQMTLDDLRERIERDCEAELQKEAIAVVSGKHHVGQAVSRLMKKVAKSL